MASKSICSACLRAMRLQARHELQITNFTSRTPYRSLRSPEASQIRKFSISQSRQEAQQQPQKAPSSPPPTENQQPAPSNDAIHKFAASVREKETFKSTTEPYIAYGSTEDLFRECNKQCNYTIPAKLTTPPGEAPKSATGEDLGEGEGWWYASKASGGLGLDVTFNTWAQVMFLHMYVLTVRLRCFPPEHARIWHQNLLDHFFYAAEDRMAMWHGMSARGIRNRYLKDLWQQWRGVLLSYDEGLIKGDAVLAAAIWRNVFKANVETDVGDLALVTAYMRNQLQTLDRLSDQRLSSGDVQFTDPAAVKQIVEQQSPQMKHKFSEEQLQGLQQETT